MRTLLRLVCVSAILMAVAGCETDPVGIEGGGVDHAAKLDGETPLQHHALLETLDYEVISGRIFPEKGGMVVGAASTWPKGNSFGLMVPAGAIPTRDAKPVEFSLRVPTYASYMRSVERDLPLVFRLEPHGMQFRRPVTVMGTYMPWDSRVPTHHWHVTPEYEGGEVVDVRYEEFGEVDVEPGPGGLRVLFDVNHFSDWETGQLPD